MNFIRKILPGGSHRMEANGDSLDLAYITPRMMAFSYPSDKLIESLYHNSIDDVSKFLNEKHGDKYLIFNLSGIQYQNEKFKNNVVFYPWPDHKAPPLYDIFDIISKSLTFLGKNKENVICVHCLAGKGRTGTVCCAILLFSKMFKCAQDANDYFSSKRFKKLNKGVQEPSQLRYLNYFDFMLNNPQFNGILMKVFQITQIDVSGIKVNDGESIEYKVETNYYKEDETENFRTPGGGYIVTGDVTINIYRNGVLKAWVFFNTSFMDENKNSMFFRIKDIDPRFLVGQNDYNLMTVQVMYSPFFFKIPEEKNQNEENNNINNNPNRKNNNIYLCSIKEMFENEKNKINRMNQLLYYVNTRDPKMIYEENKMFLFGDNPDDISESLEKARKPKNK